MSGRDRVAEFAAAHRARVRAHHADDLTWRRIETLARQARRRRRARRTLGGVAAAAVLVAAGLTAADLSGGLGQEAPGPAGGGAAPASGRESGTTGGGTGLGAGAHVVALAVSAEGTLATVSWPCGAPQECTLLLARDPSGTWTRRSDLGGVGPVDLAVGTGPAGAEVLWTAGPQWGLARSTDGGQTWEHVPYAGGDPVAVGTAPGGALVLTLGGCDGTTCTASVSTPVAGDDRAASPTVPLPARVPDPAGGSAVLADSIGATGEDPRVVLPGAEGGIGSVWGLQDGRLVPVGLPEVTADPACARVAAFDGLLALCGPDGAEPVLVALDGDGWQLAGAVPVDLGDGAASVLDVGERTVLVAGGGRVLSSADGGASWVPAGAGDGTARVLLDSADTSLLLEQQSDGSLTAVPRATPGPGAGPESGAGTAYLTSTDGGRTWWSVPLPGPGDTPVP